MMSDGMELKVIQHDHKFLWNFEAVKGELTQYIEQYSGLVVTDTNLGDMERTQKEVASLRIKLSKFRMAVKKELEKPFLDFDAQIKELLNLVDSAERPIMDQLAKYETVRRRNKSDYLQKIINKTALDLGLGDAYRDQIVIADKWLNRTSKISEIEADIQLKVCWFLDIQQKDKDAAVYKSEKVEMAKFLCESLSIGLATPLTFTEIESRVDSFDLTGLKAHIQGEVAKRKEREDRAAQMAVERAEAARVEQERRVEQARLAEERRQEIESYSALLKQELSAIPDTVEESPPLIDVSISLIGIAPSHLDVIRQLLIQLDVNYLVSKKPHVKVTA